MTNERSKEKRKELLTFDNSEGLKHGLGAVDEGEGDALGGRRRAIRSAARVGREQHWISHKGDETGSSRLN